MVFLFRVILERSIFLKVSFLHQATLTSVCERFLRQTNIFLKTTTERDLTQRLIIFCLLVSQLVPSNPAVHVHVYVLTPSVQAPLFWQGSGWQSSISKNKTKQNKTKPNKTKQNTKQNKQTNKQINKQTNKQTSPHVKF